MGKPEIVGKGSDVMQENPSFVYGRTKVVIDKQTGQKMVQRLTQITSVDAETFTEKLAEIIWPLVIAGIDSQNVLVN